MSALPDPERVIAIVKEFDDPKPRLGFKTVGTAELASTGRSVKLEISECTRNAVYDCRQPLYISREYLVQLLHGHRKTAGIYILVPADSLDDNDSEK